MIYEQYKTTTANKMASTFEVRIYDISRLVDQNQRFSTAKEAFELLTVEELNEPHCVYENLNRKDNYNYGHGKEDIIQLRYLGMLSRIEDEEYDEDSDKIFIGIKVRINKNERIVKIVDYWFE